MKITPTVPFLRYCVLLNVMKCCSTLHQNNISEYFTTVTTASGITKGWLLRLGHRGPNLRKWRMVALRHWQRQHHWTTTAATSALSPDRKTPQLPYMKQRWQSEMLPPSCLLKAANSPKIWSANFHSLLEWAEIFFGFGSRKFGSAWTFCSSTPMASAPRCSIYMYDMVFTVFRYWVIHTQTHHFNVHGIFYGVTVRQINSSSSLLFLSWHVQTRLPPRSRAPVSHFATALSTSLRLAEEIAAFRFTAPVYNHTHTPVLWLLQKVFEMEFHGQMLTLVPSQTSVRNQQISHTGCYTH